MAKKRKMEFSVELLDKLLKGQDAGWLFADTGTWGN